MQEQCSTYDLCRPSARQSCPATGVDGGLNPPLSGAGCRPGRFCQRWPLAGRGASTKLAMLELKLAFPLSMLLSC
jgi:hypothetical protein